MKGIDYWPIQFFKRHPLSNYSYIGFDMSNKLKTYKVKDWVVFGHVFIKTPFKISDELINEARIAHILKGSSRLFASNQVVDLQAGDTMIMKADNFINHWSGSPDGEDSEAIVFQITTEFLKFIYNNELPSWFNSDPDKTVLPIAKVEGNNLVNAYYSGLLDYLANSEFLTEEIIRIKVQELIAVLVNSDSTGKVRDLFGELFSARDFNFQELIRLHLFEELNIEDLAFLTGLSLSSFKRKFSSIYGITPNKYITSKRLEKAQLLLRTTTLRVSEIAYDCGFNDIGYFSRTFKKHYNTSPSEFRD